MSDVSRWRDSGHLERPIQNAGGQQAFDAAVAAMLDDAHSGDVSAGLFTTLLDRFGALGSVDLDLSGREKSARAADFERKTTTPVRVQWDPERSLQLEPLDHHAIQVRLSGDAARRYVRDWTVSISDVTGLAHEIHRLVAADDVTAAIEKLPAEHPYPLTGTLSAVIGAS
jgi:hypothetical protein